MQLADSPRTTLLRSLVDQVSRRSPAGRRLVAVDGVDGAGTSTFAAVLAEAFRERGADTTVAAIDGFHRPRSARYRRGRRSPEGYYRDSFDYSTFRRVLIDPFRMGGSAGFQLAAFDVRSDSRLESRWETANADAILVVEGIFLHRLELVDLWDFTIFLDVPWDLAAARVAQREGTKPDPSAPGNTRYRGGQEIYFAESAPKVAADVVVDNADPDHPRQFRGDPV